MLIDLGRVIEEDFSLESESIYLNSGFWDLFLLWNSLNYGFRVLKEFKDFLLIFFCDI